MLKGDAEKERRKTELIQYLKVTLNVKVCITQGALYMRFCCTVLIQYYLDIYLFIYFLFINLDIYLLTLKLLYMKLYCIKTTIFIYLFYLLLGEVPLWP